MINSVYSPDVYSGNGSTTVFARNFLITDSAHLKVVEVDDTTLVETTLVENTHYTVADVGEATGDITFLTAPASGKTITFSLDISPVQAVNLTAQGPYSAVIVMTMIDLLTQMVQQLTEEVARSPKVTIASGDTGEDLITAINTSVAAAAASATAASASQTAAAASATAAAASATAAAASATTASTAATNASNAQTAAETAETNAETAQTAAEAAQTAAEAAQTAAEAAQTAAETAQTAAETAETNAAASEAAAATSEANAATSATNAATSATNAATSETNAGNSATAAAASAAAAAAEVGLFEVSDISIKTDNYTVLAGDVGKTLLMNASSAKAFTMPAISGDEVYILKNMGTAVVTITPDGSETTDKAKLAPGESVILVGDLTNTKWRMIGGKKPLYVQQITSDAAPTPNADIDDMLEVTALAAAPTFGAPSGTAVNGQKLVIRIKDNGTARALAWNAVYTACGVALPTTTVLSKWLVLGFIYNSTDSEWQLVASAQEE